MSDIRARFGGAVRVCRSRQRLTQEELAERSGLSQKFIGEIERGTANPTIDTVAQLASALAVQVGELFGPEDVEPDHQYRISTRELQMVREAAHSLDSVMQRFPSHPDVHYRPRRRKK